VLNLIFQVITTSCLIIGVISGEAVSNKVFGFSKKWYLNIIEVFLFITLLIILFNNFYVSELNIIVVFLLNFFFGITSITITRAVLSGAGFFSKRINEKKELNTNINENVLMIGVTRNLLSKGMNKQEIRNLLENSGFSKKKASKVVKNIDLDKTEVIGTKRNHK